MIAKLFYTLQNVQFFVRHKNEFSFLLPPPLSPLLNDKNKHKLKHIRWRYISRWRQFTEWLVFIWLSVKHYNKHLINFVLKTNMNRQNVYDRCINKKARKKISRRGFEPPALSNSLWRDVTTVFLSDRLLLFNVVAQICDIVYRIVEFFKKYKKIISLVKFRLVFIWM